MKKIFYTSKNRRNKVYPRKEMHRGIIDLIVFRKIYSELALYCKD